MGDCEDADYTVVCISELCRLYDVRQHTMKNFGLLNQVQNVDKQTFERLKELMGRKREHEDLGKANKRVCEPLACSLGNIEGNTLEVLSQDILCSQQDAAPELLESEDADGCTTWGASVTLLESDQPAYPPLLYSEDIRCSSPPPMTL